MRLVGLPLLGAMLALAASVPARAEWSSTCWDQFPDEATARAAAAALGADFPVDGSIPTGNRNYALVAPVTEWITRPAYDPVTREMTAPGEKRPGYWAMVRFNLATPEGAAAHAQHQALGVCQTLASPSNVFQ